MVAVAWSSYSNLIASAGFEKDKTIKVESTWRCNVLCNLEWQQVWNPATQTGVGSLHGHLAAVTDLAYSLDGSELATTSADTTVRAIQLPASA